MAAAAVRRQGEGVVGLLRGAAAADGGRPSMRRGSGEPLPPGQHRLVPGGRRLVAKHDGGTARRRPAALLHPPPGPSLGWGRGCGSRRGALSRRSPGPPPGGACVVESRGQCLPGCSPGGASSTPRVAPAPVCRSPLHPPARPRASPFRRRGSGPSCPKCPRPPPGCASG